MQSLSQSLGHACAIRAILIACRDRCLQSAVYPIAPVAVAVRSLDAVLLRSLFLIRGTQSLF
jgi:hypothetical protein